MSTASSLYSQCIRSSSAHNSMSACSWAYIASTGQVLYQNETGATEAVSIERLVVCPTHAISCTQRIRRFWTLKIAVGAGSHLWLRAATEREYLAAIVSKWDPYVWKVRKRVHSNWQLFLCSEHSLNNFSRVSYVGFNFCLCDGRHASIQI